MLPVLPVYFMKINLPRTKCGWLIIMFVCLICININAQSVSIKGSVKDKLNASPLEDVVVNVSKTNYHTHTDDKGYFFFVSIPANTYELEFEKAGYEKQKITVDLLTDTASITILLEPKPVLLNEVAVTGDRPVSAASSSYISQVDFINRPKNSAQDMLRLVPGLFIAQHAGGGKSEQIFIRGFDCDHGTDVATFVDGIPVNMPSHGHGQGYADLHFLIPEVVEGMSVFKGASSPLYGDFATAAAVNFKTLDTLSYNLVQMETGSVPRTGAITSNRFLGLMSVPENNQKLSSYFALDLIANRGFFDVSQDFKRANFFSKTTIALNENSQLRFSVSGFGSSWNASGQIPERAVKEGSISRYGSIDPREGGTTQRNNYNAVYTTVAGRGELETQVYVFTYRFKLFSNFTFFLDDTINGDMIEQTDNRTVRGLNSKYTVNHKFFKLENKFTIGVAFRADEIENQLWKSPNRIRESATALANIYQRSNSAFVNEVFRFNDHFRIEAGVRYDYYIFDVEDLIPTDSTHQNYSGYNYQSAFNPKLNVIYTVSDKLQFFFNAGSGFHSNDARSTVQDKGMHRLPLAVSAEAGSLFHIANKAVVSATVWAMDLDNELVYVGDDGTTENKGASRRVGIDLSLRAQLAPWLFLDADFNYAQSRFLDTIFGRQLETDYFIPLAPALTSAGGITVKLKRGFEGGLRYRFMEDRPANETNTVIAYGYNVFDLTANYTTGHFKLGLVIENIFNTNWNEAQFATESRLRNETTSVEELHYTPGTPFYAKIIVGYMF